ncbi:MAG: peptidoglycan DD-metalloendopeptidase family protein, partial [Micromonosporaceae bacterium]
MARRVGGAAQPWIWLAGLGVSVILVSGVPAPESPTLRSEPDRSLRSAVASELTDRARSTGVAATADRIRVTVTRGDADWGFGAGVVTAPARRGAYPYGWLFLSRRVGDGWRVALDGDPEFAELAGTAPVLSYAERELFTARRGEAGGDTRTGMRLPYAVGQAWTYTGGPHPMGGSTLSSIDLAGGDLKVRAARAGTAYTMCKGWIRVVHRNGYATDYYHLWRQVKVDGTEVSAGALLGAAGTDVTCGGSATGRHVHFSLRRDGKYVPITGHGLGGWVIYQGDRPYRGYARHGSARAEVGDVLTNHGALRRGEGIVDTDGGGTLHRRSGPGTGHEVVGALPD